MPQSSPGKKKSDARRITLKFPATCKSCGAALPVGEKVTWYPGGTVYGTRCHPSPFASAKPKAAKPKAASPKGKAAAQSAPTVPVDAINQLLSLLQSLQKP